MTLLAVGGGEDWMYLRLEVHPMLRMCPEVVRRLSLKGVVQRHAILDKADADKADAMAEMERKMTAAKGTRR